MLCRNSTCFARSSAVSIKMELMSIQTYDDFSADYDRFVNWGDRLVAEIPFIESNLAEIKHTRSGCLSVLDAACGTGMHAIELARRGYRAAGADQSRMMVQKAKINAEEAAGTISFKTAGFAKLAKAFTDEKIFPFDALMCLGNSLPHLTSHAMIQKALADFAACLKPGGLLILQNRNFDAVMASQERWIRPQSRISEKEEWLFLRFYDFDPDGLITFNIVRLHRKEEENWQQQVSTVKLFPLLQEDLLKFLETSGFTSIRTFGRMENIPFDPKTSESLVVTAKKKG